MKYLFSIIILVIVSTSPAKAYQILQNDVSHQEGQYNIYVEAIIDAPTQKTLEILTDYNHLDQINTKIIKSEIIQIAGDEFTVRTVIHDCISFFCKDVTHTQKTSFTESEIIAITVAKDSDFTFGVMNWKIEPAEKTKTKIKFSANLKPSFLIPPMIGPLLVKKSLSKAYIESIINIEKRADEHKK